MLNLQFINNNKMFFRFYKLVNLMLTVYYLMIGMAWAVDDNDQLLSEQNSVKDPKSAWVYIPGGTFQMGERHKDAEKDATYIHQETIGALQVMRHEVTVNDYLLCVNANVCWLTMDGRSDNLCNDNNPERSNHPMNCIDWYQAGTYCAWMDARLPTEAEWEYVATNGGKPNIYPWGDDKPDCSKGVLDAAKHPNCGNWVTEDVCTHPAGNSEAGLCDLVGNVFEWVHDWYIPNYKYDIYINYDRLPWVKNLLTGEKVPNRGMRGGGIGSDENYRVRNRVMHSPSFQYPGLGVRCVKDEGIRPQTTYDRYIVNRTKRMQNRKSNKKFRGEIQRISSEDVSTTDATGTIWNHPPNIVIPKSGIKIHYKKIIKAAVIEITLDNNDFYNLEFFNNRKSIGNMRLDPKYGNGLAGHHTKLPIDVGSNGFNEIIIRPEGGDNFYSLGHIVFK